MPYMPDYMRFETFGHKVIGSQSGIESVLNRLEMASTLIYSIMYIIDILIYTTKYELRGIGKDILPKLYRP